MRHMEGVDRHVAEEWIHTLRNKRYPTTPTGSDHVHQDGTSGISATLCNNQTGVTSPSDREMEPMVTMRARSTGEKHDGSQ